MLTANQVTTDGYPSDGYPSRAVGRISDSDDVDRHGLLIGESANPSYNLGAGALNTYLGSVSTEAQVERER